MLFKLFEYKAESKITSSATVLEDGTVVLGTESGTLLWLKDGVKVRDFETGGKITGKPLLLDDGRIVVGSADKKLYWIEEDY